MRSGNDFSDEVVENWGTETQSNFPSFLVYVYFVCKLQWLCVSFLTSLLTVSNYHYDFINILCSVRNYAGIVVKKITCLPKIRSSVFQGVGLLILQFWEIGVKQQQHHQQHPWLDYFLTKIIDDDVTRVRVESRQMVNEPIISTLLEILF